MPVIYQKLISREDLQANPEALYLFGDNLARRGLGGQARAMRGEPNAVGVATKKDCTMRDSDFFSDDEYATNCRQIDADLARAIRHLDRGFVVVVPLDGLGTGLSELATRAPYTNAYLLACLSELERL